MGLGFGVLVCNVREHFFNRTIYGANRSMCNGVREWGRQDCGGLCNGDVDDDRIWPLYCVQRRYAKLHGLDVHSEDGPAKSGVFRYDWSMRESRRRKLHSVVLCYRGLSASRLYRVWRYDHGLHVDIDLRQHGACDERQSHAAGCVHANRGHDFDDNHSLHEHGLYRDFLLDDVDLFGFINHDDDPL